MYARTFSGTVHGIEGMIVTVEADLANGLPQFDIVGLGGSAVKESRDRVRAALRNAGFDFPLKRLTVNLAPADLRKEGTGFDLSIAINLLISSRQLSPREERTIILGELALDGSLRAISGVLPLLLKAREEGFTHVILPYQNREEAWLVDMVVMPACNLQEAVRYWRGEQQPPDRSEKIQREASEESPLAYDFTDVVGQTFVKRGLEVAAAGFHNILLVGPPGSGKTLMANCLPSIMPQMSVEESFEVTKIYSIAGHLTRKSGLVSKRPLRSPHHTTTAAALAGGGAQSPRPGECSLAHGGILFLDELPEFSRNALEVLRQPLESGQVAISRVKQVYRYPARFLLVGAMNPCPCGFYYNSHGSNQCVCTPYQVQRYRSRLSGPLMDRIDIHLEVPRVSVDLLGERREAESSESIRQRIEQARAIQAERFHKRLFPFNSGMSVADMRRYVQIDKEAQELLSLAFERMGLSARAYDRILKVARTIADLQGMERVEATHVAEAIRYRALDRE